MSIGRFLAVLALLVPSSTWCFTVPSSSSSSRREMIQKVGVAFVTGIYLPNIINSNDNAAQALEGCKKGANNCVTTLWTPPSQSVSLKDLTDALNAYPQEGQGSVDLGGWKVVQDDGKGNLHAEFTSGKGKFAMLFNGGKPFVDDTYFESDPDSGVVKVKSSSRIGDSDFGVNKKRVDYIAAILKEKGWTV